MSKSFSSSLISIEKNDKEILNTIVTNVIKMITERGYLEKTNLNENIKKYRESSPDDFTYKIPIQFKKFKNFVFKIVHHNITTINKSSGISDFLHKYKNTINMLIVVDASKKARNDVYMNFQNSQVFLKKELMINIVEHNLVPQHILLDEKTKDSFYDTYNTKKSNMLKINYTDPIAKYYNARPGNIFKIVRPSGTSGFVNSYRLVIKKEH
jgi:DNA-directed RNA polymerase subunit H (RpoH/RPB5)